MSPPPFYPLTITHHLVDVPNHHQLAEMTIQDGATAEGDAPQLSKNQLKKLAKGKGKKDKPKPTWNQPGEGKKKKDDTNSNGASTNKAISLPKKTYVNDTPKGEKKKLGEMEEAYHPAAVESAWQDWWEAR